MDINRRAFIYLIWLLIPALAQDTVAVDTMPTPVPADSPEDTTAEAIAPDTLRIPQPDTSVILRASDFEIVVSADRPHGNDPSARPTVVSGKKVRETPRSTPLEALSQESADIYVSSRGAGLHGISSGASGGIYIRGLGGSPNSQVLVVEDGAPDYQGIFGHPIPDAFFPSLIDRVTVVKGGDCVRYGTNALGGAVIVENRWPETTGLRIENDAAYGSFNTFRERITLLDRKNRTDMTAAFSSFSTGGHRDGADGSSVAGRVGLRFLLPDDLSVALHGKAVFLDGGDPGSVMAPYTDHRFAVLRGNAGARIEKTAGLLNLTVVPWFNAGEHRLYDCFFSRDYLAGTKAEAAAELLDGRLDLLGGVSAEHIDGEVKNRITGKEDTVESVSGGGPYGQAEFSPGAGFIAVGGGRLHWSSRYGMVPLYKAGIVWERYKAFSLHTRITRNFRQPTIRELYLPFPAANPGLRPEYSVNGDAGVESVFAGCRASLSVYRTWATDLIKYFGVRGGAEVVNIGYLEITGIEGEFKVPELGPWGVSVSGCWQDVGKYTRQNPEAKLNAALNYAKTTGVGLLECSLSAEWVHGLYMGNYWRDSMPDVFFIDGSIRYRVTKNGGISVEPYCIIRNILDSPYEYIQDYPMPGINILAGLTIKV
ncbi:MAG: TonB-dependent receptor [Chitinispirillaceae bacterium]|nr:TonB-dependent receptor [Chitinispirillaceae bacterium]